MVMLFLFCQISFSSSNFRVIKVSAKKSLKIKRKWKLQIFQGSFKFKYNSRYVEDENGKPETKLFITFYW